MIEVLPEAMTELFEAVDWYEEQREGLGEELFDAIERAMGRIMLQGPRAFPRVLEDPRTRRVLVQRFPYAVIYADEATLVRIVAFAHLKRRPAYWSNRVPLKDKG